ncbi:ribonuclease M5 [Oenococcus oeni]|uniref:Ribonuclease M5 n=8 Tax=Oenococcus oeni TaxID=1247 RepID=Q04DR7_OENOB|nr:ribonuclease M5 [Oenococcus oeni]EAV39042.1 small primase-like protein, Toprim domain [Oenococcus oeni ATCC BAA-1163]KGO15936.1 ribonuclease M5 [Oenococcus oeni X2L]MDI4583654.1 ribonuclease M5 [Oenococcus sp. UCMA 14587]ABJ57405.1 RNAse M5 [Oenococcus oeni PSU-1]AVI94705.1 ribonuclease M5 [Oenococcus oeni]
MAQELKKTIFIVEGKNDTARLRLAFGDSIETIETGGSKIRSAVLDLIEQSARDHELILLTDPDFQGERIRKIVLERVPNIKQLFLNKIDGKPNHKGSLGVEHADPKLLKKLLGKYVKEFSPTLEIQRSDLVDFGLIDGAGSAVLRKKISDQLHLGNTNGKQFLKRLQMFGITKKELKEAIKNLE